MRIARLCIAFAFCLCAGAFLLQLPARADIAEVPRFTVNISYGGDFYYAGALEKAGFQAGFAYSLRNFLQHHPDMPSGLEEHEANSTVKEQNDQGKKSFISLWQRQLTSVRTLMYTPGVKVKELKKNYIASNVSKHPNLKLNEEFLSQFRQGQVNLDKPCQVVVFTSPKRKEVISEKKKMSINNLKMLAALTPVALLQKGNTVYAAFLDYGLNPISIDEEEHTGRFDPPAANFECSWKALYLFPLREIISPATATVPEPVTPGYAVPDSASTKR